jgi:hypothetical protein
MWEPQRLTILWDSTACYRDTFTFTGIFTVQKFRRKNIGREMVAVMQRLSRRNKRQALEIFAAHLNGDLTWLQRIFFILFKKFNRM